MKIAATSRSFLRTYFVIGAAICLAAIYQTELQTQALLKLRTRYKWALLLLVFGVNAAAGLYLVFMRRDIEALWEKIRWPTIPPAAVRIIGGIILFLVPLPLLLYARTDFFGRGLDAFFRLLWLFWWLVLIQTVVLAMGARLAWPIALAFSLLFDGAAAQLFSLATPISNYPFSMGWSEASRFYYGSLPFSESLYGTRVPLSILHGSRYLMLAIPFIIRGLPIWSDRLWQQLLWFGVTAMTSWSLVRRFRLDNWQVRMILGSWFFLYLFQGAVYYHLQVCVIVVLLGVSPQHPWRSLLAVVVASFWAGMSRLNWYPVPAMLAIALYVLEEPWARARAPWEYLRKPMLWGVVGILTALAGQAFYVIISGNANLAAFGSSFTSALLWYRWFPSATNPIGIIPGVIIVSLPLWALIVWIGRRQRGGVHPIRWLLLAAMTVVLLLGGLVVSTKIGGGGDLHNMDAYMVLLGILASYLMCGRVALETESESSRHAAPWPLVALMLIVPVAFAIMRLPSPFLYDRGKAAAAVATLGQEVASYNNSGPVLFMYERQLLTFGMVPRVPLVADYEVLTLMEMAISGNRPYLEQFYSDLASHRFSAIVAHPQNLGVETGDFIEESDAWNRLVAQPMLCQYKPAVTLDYSNVQILVPRARPCPEFPPVVQ